MVSVVGGSLRADDAEFVAWRACAAAQGLSFNAWARRALNDQLELERAVAVADAVVEEQGSAAS